MNRFIIGLAVIILIIGGIFYLFNKNISGSLKQFLPKSVSSNPIASLAPLPSGYILSPSPTSGTLPNSGTLPDTGI